LAAARALSMASAALYAHAATSSSVMSHASGLAASPFCQTYSFLPKQEQS
jgi:hypothetical protein